MRIEIKGKPTTKERPRFNGRYAYTPKKTKEYEEYVRTEYITQGGKNYGEMPVEVIMTFIFPVPKSWTQKKQKAALNGEICMTSRPDADNLAKSVLDSLNGVAYNDDSQVSQMILEKKYGEQPKTILEIKPMKL